MVEIGELVISIRGDIADIQTKLTAVQNKLSNVGKITENITERFRSVGRELRRTGTILSIIGGGIVFGLTKVAQKASEFDETIGGAFQEIQNTVIPIFNEFALIVAETILPVIGWLIEHLRKVWDWFMNINPTVREFIIKAAFIAGVVLLAVGAFASFIGALGFASSQILRFGSWIKYLVGFVGKGLTFGGGILGLIGIVLFLALVWSGAFEDMEGGLGTFLRFVRGGLAVIADIFINFIDLVVKGIAMFLAGIGAIAKAYNWIARRSFLPEIPTGIIEAIDKFVQEQAKPLPGLKFTQELAQERAGKGFGGPGGLFGPKGIIEQGVPAIPIQPAVEVNIDEMNITNYRPEDMKSLVKEAANIIADNVNRSVAV